MFNAQLGAPSHLVGLLGIANIVLDLATVGLATKPPSSATTVSYTHLDVYKRQALTLVLDEGK